VRRDKPYKRQLRTDANNFKQRRNEGAREYAQRARAILCDLEHYEMKALAGADDEEVFRWVTRGLLPAHYGAVARWDNEDWEAALAHLEDLESKGVLAGATRGVNLVDTTGSARKCFNCGEVGHMQRECQAANPSGRFHGKCHKCGRQGHMAKDCRSKKNKVKCFACDKEGHMARECPERQDGGSAPPVGGARRAPPGLQAPPSSTAGMGARALVRGDAEEGVLAVGRVPDFAPHKVVCLTDAWEGQNRAYRGTTHVQVGPPAGSGIREPFRRERGVMLDSGSAANLVSADWVMGMGWWPLVNTTTARKFATADKAGAPLIAVGTITLPVRVCGLAEEKVQFYVAEIPFPFLLGRPAVRVLRVLLDIPYGRVYFRDEHGRMVGWHALELERGSGGW
jgi:hypothetical protein